MAKLWWALVAIIFVETTAFFSQLPRKPTWALKVADEPAQSLNEQDEAVEKQWRSLEYAMESAAKNDDFDKAQECSRQLFSLQLDSAAAVLAVNTAFYRAFTDRDLDSMASLWWDDASVTCSHPGQPPLVGYRSVFETWAGMLSWDGSLPGGKQAAAEAGGKTAAVGIPLEVSPVQVQCNVRGVSAVVSCLEQVKSTATGKSLGQTMHATNVFRKVGNQWLMVHHQASAVPQAGGQASKQVSKQSLLDAVNRLRQKKKRLGEDGEDETGVRVRKFQSDGKGGVVETTSELQGEEEEEDEDEDGVELEFILGDGTEEKDEEDEEEIELFLRGLGEKDDNESGEEGDDDDDDEDSAAFSSAVLTPELMKQLQDALPEINAAGEGGMEGATLTVGEGEDAPSISLKDVLEKYKRLQDMSPPPTTKAAAVGGQESGGENRKEPDYGQAQGGDENVVRSSRLTSELTTTSRDAAAAAASPPSRLTLKRVAMRFWADGGGDDSDGETRRPLSFGWARDTMAQRIVSVVEGGQAALAGVQAGWVVVGVGSSAQGKESAAHAALALARDDDAAAEVDGVKLTRVKTNEEFTQAMAQAKQEAEASSSAVVFAFKIPATTLTTDSSTFPAPSSFSSPPTAPPAPEPTLVPSRSMLGGIGDDDDDDDDEEEGGGSHPPDASSPPPLPPPKLTTSQATLQALRSLCKSGKLRADQRVRLTTSLVANTASPRHALVETAFEVLLLPHQRPSPEYRGGADETEEKEEEAGAWEEFAEQCRDIADAAGPY